MSEEAEACFVLPLREAAAHFACRNARSVEEEMDALTMATLMQALTCPQTWEQGFSHFSASKAESVFNKVLASLSRRPFVDTTKEEK
jgi:hypothetical protein